MLAGVAALGALAVAVPAAADAENPDWPCVQRKVPTLTPAAVWTGPQFDNVTASWGNDEDVRNLVNELSQRRLPIEQAQEKIEAFAEEVGEDGSARLVLLFEGLFTVMNAERSEIVEGIERYGRRQKVLAEEVRTTAAETDALRQAEDTDPAVLEQAETKLLWQIRVFNERRASLPYVCEVPRFVEQRLFALGRSISKALQ